MPLKPTLVFSASLLALLAATDAQAQAARTIDGVKVETLASGLEHPWGLAQLPDGAWLITERPGRARIYDNGNLSAPLEGVPRTEEYGQGGLLDVALDPNFQENGFVYFSFADIDASGNAGTAIARARLVRDGTPRLADTTTLFSMDGKSSAGQHFGSRIVFQDEDTFWFTIGDRGNRPSAQDKSIASGSVLRLNTDGSVPEDNPFLNEAGTVPQIWSIGHRNPQGAARHPETGKLWTVEHGARGGDEINVPEKGKNYGWPEISYGRHYSGARIGLGTSAPGLEQPIHYWDPSIAPSGMMFYTGEMFSDWQGDVFVGALKERKIVRLDLEGEQVVGTESLLEDLGRRIRALAQGADGAIYVITDEPDGLLLRLAPAS